MEPEIISKKNYFLQLSAGLGLMLSIFGFIVIVRMLIVGQYISVENILAGIGSLLIMLIAVPWGLSLRISINRHRLLSRSIFKHQSIEFKNVISLRVSGNGRGGYNMTLRQTGARNQVIGTSLFSNQKELIKAALEATQYANPDAIFEGYAADFIHQPPYDVLKIRQSEKTSLNKFYKTQNNKKL